MSSSPLAVATSDPGANGEPKQELQPKVVGAAGATAGDGEGSLAGSSGPAGSDADVMMMEYVEEAPVAVEVKVGGEGCGGKRCGGDNDGNKFVVQEELELRESGTGQHLTMEEFDLCVGRSPIIQELMRRQNVANSGSNNGTSTPIQRSSSNSSNGATDPRWHSGWLRSIRNVIGSIVADSCDR